jgi:hypothetical protein
MFVQVLCGFTSRDGDPVIAKSIGGKIENGDAIALVYRSQA